MTDESIFAAALGIGSPAARAEYLDRVCAGQPELRREVEELLQAHAGDNPLDRPPADLARTGAYEPQPEGLPAAAVGDRVGPYRLMEQIGEGGFGLVFVAEQSEPVRRKVALKVLKPGMDTRDVVARFEAERQALALMDHPNIARVFDAGSTPAGRPYFVMELVRGLAVTDYCDQHKLPPRERLALFVQVCHAVQHAHQKGVIHRDLKPSNVLVTVIDGVAVPKVIDFGVAKAVGQSLTEKTIYTRFAQMIGTPLYMSPEQAEMSGVDVDTRADVYALGVLLYELLTGLTPFDKDRFRKAAFDEIRRILREEDPPRPSTRLSTLGATLSAVSERRGTDPGKLAGLVRGELDWIVMKCLEKERGRRYETANGLARDVQRYLAGDAVEACPPTLSYRLRKAFRKYKAAASVAAGFAAVLLLGSAMTAWQAVRATSAEREAARQRDEAVASKNEAVTSKDEAVAARESAAAERDKVSAVNDSLRRLAAEQRRTLYATSMNLAQSAWETGNPGRTFDLLRRQLPGPGEDDLRGFEWHYWDRFAHLDLKTVRIPALGGTGAESAVRHGARFSPDGTRVAAFATDPAGPTTALKLWDAETGRELWSTPVTADLTGYPMLVFSGDGRRLAAARNVRAAGENDLVKAGELRVWDSATGKIVYSDDFPGVLGIAFPALTHDGSRVAFVTYGRGWKTRLTVRQLPDGHEVFRYPRVDGQAVVFNLAFSPDGKRLAAIGGDGALGLSTVNGLAKIWDLETGRELQKLAAPGKRLREIAFSPDGTRVAAAALFDEPADQIILWDCDGGRQLQVLNVPGSSGRNTYHYPLVFDAAGKRLALRHGAQAFLFDVDPGRAAGVAPLPKTFRGHAGPVWDVAFVGPRLLTLDEQGVIKQWDPAQRERPLRTPFGGQSGWTAVLPNPDGSRIAYLSGRDDADRRLRLGDGSGHTVGESVLPRGHVHEHAFSLDGRTFAFVWHEEQELTGYTLYVWDAVTGKEIRHFSEADGRAVDLFALSPDGVRVVTLALPTDTIATPGVTVLSVRETATGREVYSRRCRREFYPAYSPDGRWIVYADASPADREDHLVWLDSATGEEKRSIPVRKGRINPADRVVFSRDGRRLAVRPALGPAPVYVWDVEPMLRGESPEPALALTGHGGGVGRVAFSADGRRILTSGSGVIKLWDAVSGRELLTLKAAGATTDEGYFSPDGRTIWGGLDEEGRLWGWDGRPVAGEKQP